MIKMLLEKIYKEKMFDESEINKTTERIINETKIVNTVLQFIEDSGNYKKRSVYKISDYELKEKITEIKNNFIQLQANMIFADIIINSKKSLQVKYNKLSQTVFNEIMKKQNKS